MPRTGYTGWDRSEELKFTSREVHWKTEAVET